nr:Dihydrofolate reductase [uncultured bacterium]
MIGVNNALPWNKLKTDMRRFQKITTGHPVIYGSSTFLASPQNGRALPNRTNIVLTRDTDKAYEGCIMAHSLAEAIRTAEKHEGNDEIFIIGGSHIFEQALPLANRIYLTEVDTELQGDAYFPELDQIRWKAEDEGAFDADEDNQYAGKFVRYTRTGEYPIVEPYNARTEEFKKYLNEIIDEGKCPFCPGGATHRNQEMIYQNDHWWVINTLQPLANTLHHFMIVPFRHIVTMDELTAAEWEGFSKMLTWANGQFKANGLAYYWRQGEPMVTGASVSHLHVQAIAPAGLVQVNFGPYPKEK